MIYYFSKNIHGYGGHAYNDTVFSALQRKYECVNLCPPTAGGKWNHLKNLKEANDRLRNMKEGLLITDYDLPLACPNESVQQIIIAHHYDSSFSPLYGKIYQGLTHLFHRRHRNRKNQHMVVVSRYWENWFKKIGWSNLHRIPNGFDIDSFHREPHEIQAFRETYLGDANTRPIVFIGQPQKKKGGDLVCETLDREKYFLVSSGNGPLKLPCLSLQLNASEYITLLHAADITVTYSRFQEGWCRVAHESVLCGTPVVGSGLGGMSELLEEFGQISCGRASDLETSVQTALQKGSVGKEIQSQAARYSAQSMEEQWLNLVSEILTRKQT